MFLHLVRVAKEINKNLLLLKPLKLNSSHRKQNRTLPQVVQGQKTNKRPHHRRRVSGGIPCWTESMMRKNSNGSSRQRLQPGEMPANLKKRLNRKKLIKILRKCDSLERKTRSPSKQLKNRSPMQNQKRKVKNPRSLSCSEILVAMMTGDLCGTLQIFLSLMIKLQEEISHYRNLSLRSRAGTASKCSLQLKL